MEKIEFKGFYFIVQSTAIVHLLGRLISLGKNAMACTIYPFIFVEPQYRQNEELLRHEKIHIYQQLELLVVFAWLLFLLEYLYALFIKKLDARQAYYFTSSEQEAHRNAKNPNYLKTRKPYAIFKYLRDKKWLGRDSRGELIQKDYL